MSRSCCTRATSSTSRSSRRPAHDIAVALKQANATSVIFTGDPIMPRFFTKEATAQNYHPEWIMAGTVLADTSVFARTFDQSQWAHAFGLQLTPARVDPDEEPGVHRAPVVLRDEAAERQELRDHVSAT